MHSSAKRNNQIKSLCLHRELIHQHLIGLKLVLKLVLLFYSCNVTLEFNGQLEVGVGDKSSTQYRITYTEIINICHDIVLFLENPFSNCFE